MVYDVGSDRTGFGGPDYTMGGQGAQRTVDRDVGADSGEAGAGIGDWYGKGPGTRKNISHSSE
jgi:hypothetical protein